jgi:hypothetical protein
MAFGPRCIGGYAKLEQARGAKVEDRQRSWRGDFRKSPIVYLGDVEDAPGSPFEPIPNDRLGNGGCNGQTRFSAPDNPFKVVYIARDMPSGIAAWSFGMTRR